MSQPTTAPSAADRQLTATRLFDAPRDLVFKLWTDPNHLARWWGPRGFSITTHHMDFKPGGVWRYVMHGPDGRDYQNKITYTDIVEPSRIAYQVGGDKDVEPVNFHVTVTFESVGNQTRLHMRMLFPNAAARDFVIQTYGADKGLLQTLDRLTERVASITSPGPTAPFVISRTFNAPRDLVWKAWTQREALMQWFGPKGFTMTTADLDLRPGGKFHFCLRAPDGSEMWGKWAIQAVTPPERFTWFHSFSDPQGNTSRHPGHASWPLEMLSSVTLTEVNGRTTVTIQWVPVNATAVEVKTFDEGRPGMVGGWTGTFDQLAEYLAKA